ncbi:MAG TPA: ABC transporter ATP-binding protein [Tissierellaceae bacterium]|nr:ABC transporter ATP-binding protein [Tissierellaceae bacterium]
MKVVLEVNNLSKNFGNTQVLNNINLKVYEGEFIVIMGPSGSGKSTLLYNISGMDRASSGDVLFKDRKIYTLDDEDLSEIRLKHMGFVFQNSYLLRNLSIRDNIILAGFKAKLVPREEVNKKADDLMRKTGISDIAASDIKKVSGGQLQRAAICRALINQPDILFGDEPTGALNSSSTREVMDIINTINAEGTTVIIVTHDAKVASRASRVLYILDGNIHDELSLGDYRNDEMDRSSREKKLSSWLESQGF